jgi:hypothetical protein
MDGLGREWGRSDEGKCEEKKEKRMRLISEHKKKNRHSDTGQCPSSSPPCSQSNPSMIISSMHVMHCASHQLNQPHIQKRENHSSPFLSFCLLEAF